LARRTQWLADSGYAVLSVNYCGSAGFGRAFIAASEKQHGAKMHDDLIDRVEWPSARATPDATKSSFFASLTGALHRFISATFTPDIFCCSVPVVGTNLHMLLEFMPPQWAGVTEFMYRSYGDACAPEGRALLADRSPIHKAELSKKPMLIFPSPGGAYSAGLPGRVRERGPARRPDQRPRARLWVDYAAAIS
jgi:dipeptidyl aminopeptidase/acylaminoacyl peptidase